MLKNYLKAAWRNLMRNKVATFIKLAGLTIGMTCCVLILLYVVDELKFNTFNTRYGQIYRVNFIQDGDGQFRKMANTPASAGAAIVQDIPQAAVVGRIYQRSGILEPGGVGEHAAGGMQKKFQEPNIFFADRGVLDIFSIHFVEGDARTALSQARSIVLTKEMARKYFGDSPALGKAMQYENTIMLRVTGVIDKMPAASDIQFAGLIDFETLDAVESKTAGDFVRTNWLFNPAETFILLRPDQNPGPVDAAIRRLTKKYGDERVKRAFYFTLQPLSDIHLHASDIQGNESTNSITYIYIFSGIALLILLIANINFINLSNAQSLNRIAEIGVRRVSGADRLQLLLQFLGEGLLVSCIAGVLALVLATAALPVLNEVTEKDLSAGAIWNLPMLAVLGALFVGSGLLAGVYPALFITRWRLTALLKGRTGTSPAGGRWIRQSLIVAQFAIAISLMVGAIVIHRQLLFLRNKPWGFDKDEVLVVPLFGKNPSPLGNGVDGPLRARMNAFENDLRADASVAAVSVTSILPGEQTVRGLVIPEGRTEKDNIFFPWISVDYDYVSSMKMEMAAGREFSKAAGTDQLEAFIINESAVKYLGWKSAAEAVGKTFVRGPSETGKKGHIIGVIKDFNFTKLDQPLEPLVMDVNVPRFNTFAIRVRPDHVPVTLATIRKTWEHYFPEKVFEYSWLDENINALYKAQESLSQLIGDFAIIAIFISCIGLFSLASFMATQRMREIGIRKVLGASVAGVVVLLFRDFFRLVVVALVIASLLGWWLMDKWLHDFAYRIPLSWWIFAVAGLLAIGITFFTVGIQALRAARVNPAKSLHNE